MPSPEQFERANAMVRDAYALLGINHPVGCVQWVPHHMVQANDYNPNSVAHQEMKLLYTSIAADGYCVEAGTPILCADLTWRPAETLVPGTEVIAFDEQPVEGTRRRRFRTAVVTANGLREDVLMRVVTTKGEVLCTPDHPWLTQPRYGDASKRTIRWNTTADLVPGTLVSRPFEPWEVERSYEAGWLSGFLDGEGTLAVNAARTGRSVFRLSGYQRPSLTADRMLKAMQSRVACKVFTVKRSAHSKWNDMVMCRVDRLGEIMRLLGMVRPERLIEAGGRFWEGYEVSTPDSWVEVLSVELAERGSVATLSTSTGTYIADGYLMHNTQPVVVIHDAGLGKYIVVDGFHRYTALARYGDLNASTGGYLPVVVLDKTLAERMASTVRHNRARGKHSVAGMGSLVFGMLREGRTPEEVCAELGLEAEELARLTHVTGYSKLFGDVQFSSPMLTTAQVKAKAKYAREHPEELVPNDF